MLHQRLLFRLTQLQHRLTPNQLTFKAMLHDKRKPSLKDKHLASADENPEQPKRGRGRPRGNVKVTLQK
jgi:hypothetical protein